MGNSTTSLQSVDDYVHAQGIPTPLSSSPGAYGTLLAITRANDVMAAIIAERFNWKWNRTYPAPFYTNSYQQDYPQIGLTNVGWLEYAEIVDINNTMVPPPGGQIQAKKDLPRAYPYGYVAFGSGLVRNLSGSICWLYNSQMSYGAWPGAGQTYSPLVTASPIVQNPPMAILDANGNILVLTTFGTTGSTAPVLAEASSEGTTVEDGTCVWTVASPNSQGFRIFPLPGAAGPVYQVSPVAQMRAPLFSMATTSPLGAVINPLPDDYATYFRTGYRAFCLEASDQPAHQKRAPMAMQEWMMAMQAAAKQGDREENAYGMIPSTSAVDSVWDYGRNPQDPGQPY